MKKVLIVGVSVIIIILVAVSLSRPDIDEGAFHATLADPSLYENGVYSDQIMISSGEYIFDFVPNGDSPKILSIHVLGEYFDFTEDFVLNGTLHRTGVSEYYTWDYIGQKNFEILKDQDLEIIINPNGQTSGPVSVSIKSRE